MLESARSLARRRLEPRGAPEDAALIRHLEAAFGLQRHHVYTDHPLIRRDLHAHAYAQSLG